MSDFSIRCACGTMIHTSSAHVGRTIRCRCGRSVKIDAPSHEPGPPRASRRESSVSPPPTSKAVRSRPNNWLGRIRRMVGRSMRSLSMELREGRSVSRAVAWTQVVYLLAIVATWLALITASEQWLPATLLAYGPRAVVLLPLLVLVPAGLLLARRSLSFTLAGALLALTQVMGFRLGMGPTEPPFRDEAARASSVRALTLNVGGGRTSPEALIGLIVRLEPDIVTLQECSRSHADALKAIPQWQSAAHHSLCIASRWPIGEPDSMPRAEFQRVRQLGYGGAALVVRYPILRPGQPFVMTNLHLETARKGLEGLISNEGLIPDGRLPVPRSAAGGSDRVQANALIRTRESEQASRWAARDAGSTPALVAGDFNMPVESTIYRAYWRSFENAFEAKGRGLGYTKREGRLLRLRIDHLLAAPDGFRATGAWLGPDVGSDHRPMVADFAIFPR
jgi:vancomycin resistance protein VanJ